jgi:protein TonB
MKKNNMAVIMLGISIVMHSIILFGTAKKNVRAAPALSANKQASTVKIIKTKIAEQKKQPQNPAAKKPVEKLKDAAAENHEEEEAGEEAEEGMSEGEYNELLAYIKKYIDRNLVYPPIARQRNVEGTAGVSFVIDSAGRVVSITLKHSSGSSILDNAAVSLIKRIGYIKNISIKKDTALNINVDYTLTE